MSRFAKSEIKRSILSSIQNGFIESVEMEFITISEDKLSIGTGEKPSINITAEGDLTVPSNITIAGKFYHISEISEFAFQNTNLNKVIFESEITRIQQSCFEKSRVAQIVFLRSTFTDLPIKCFSECTNLISVQLPTIKNVGEKAFYYSPITVFNFDEISLIHPYSFSHTDLQNVEIRSQDITTLPDYAFYGSNIETITLPNSVNYIGSYCFSESKLREFVGLENLQQIGEGAFMLCLSLEKVDLSKSALLGSIESSTFEMSLMSSIKLPSSIECLQAKSFYGCAKLINLEFPIKLQQIEESAFEDCTSLISVDLSHTQCNKINNKAFSGCTDLSAVTFSSSLSFIGSEVFLYTQIEEIKLNSCDEIGISAFKSCNQLLTVNLEDTSIITLPEGAFSNDASLQTVILPDGLASIQKDCFLECSSLFDINFPQSLEKIDQQAFKGCSSLAAIDLEQTNISHFENSVFMQCTKLEEITWPIRPTSIIINVSSFKEIGIKTLVLPSCVSFLGIGCFQKCVNLESVDLSLIKSDVIKGDVFEDCTKLVSLKLSDNINMIMAYAFSNVGLTTFKATNLTLFASHVFYNSKKLEKVDLSGCQIPYIGMQTFYQCTKLRVVNLSNTAVTKIKFKAFYRCTSLTTVIFPRCLKEIEDTVFTESTALESVDFSDTDLEIIRPQTFKSCTSLKEIKWSEVIQTIGYNLIEGCSNFGTMKVTGSMKTFGDDAFGRSGVLVADLSTFTGMIPNKIFFKCTRLESIIFPRNPYMVGVGSFKSCESLQSLVMTEGCTELGKDSMRGMYSLVFADLGAIKATSIPDGLFAGNRMMDIIILPPMVKSFGASSLYACNFSNVYYAGTDPLDGVPSPFPSTAIIHVTKDFNETTFCGVKVVKDYSPTIPEESSLTEEEESSSNEAEEDTTSTSNKEEEDTTSTSNKEEEDTTSTSNKEDEDTTSSNKDEVSSSDKEEDTSSFSKEEENASDSSTETSSSSKNNGVDDDEDEDEVEPFSVGAAVGGAIGGTVLFIGAIAIACVMMKRNSRKIIEDIVSKNDDQSTTWMLADTQIALTNPQYRSMWNDYLEESDRITLAEEYVDFDADFYL